MVQSNLQEPVPREPREPIPPQPSPSPWMRWITLMLLLGWGAMLLSGVLLPSPSSLSYSEFVNAVEDGRVTSVVIDPGGAVDGKLRDGSTFRTQIPTALAPADLEKMLVDAEVTIEATGTEGSLWWAFLMNLLPLAVLIGLFVWLGRRTQAQVGGLASFGRSQARVIEKERPNTRFSDVAGYEGVKREVGELIDFLRDPDRFRRAGAKAPRGVLLVGPPGTGKTLLARAVAGEAQVPFLSVTGSSFVEMFVGVGASRVRDLFKEARKRAPAIIFLDEIDSLGSRGGVRGMGAHDEREQTLNQLLAELDGFDPAEGIAVLAATNRPDVLDPALLRPGRFDRQIVVPLPSLADRRAILEVHTRSKTLADDVDLDALARGTPGFSGADLANLANEAAINAARQHRTIVTAADFDEARDRVMLGRREDSSVMLAEEKETVAVHEAGHALVAALSDHADPVAKVTILPAGMSLGATHQLPLDERRLHKESHLRDALAVRLGGRAAELLVFGEGSTGAAADLTSATELATRMVTEFGLSEELGPVGYGSTTPTFLPGTNAVPRSWAEQTQWLIDREVARFVREAEERAKDLLSRHRSQLDVLAAMLLERETVDGAEVYRLVGRDMPQAPPAVLAPPMAAAAAAAMDATSGNGAAPPDRA